MEIKTFKANFDQVRSACEYIREAAERAGFDAKSAFHIELACDEACTNIVEHAYAEQEDASFSLGWEVRNRAFVITLHDQGKVFDPNLIEQPSTLNPDATIDEVVAGGLGMHFMRKLMDEIRYQFGAEGNQLDLIKWLPLPPGVEIDRRQLRKDVHLLRVLGRLDNRLSSEIEPQLQALLESNAPKIIVDLSNIDYINSAGLRVLVSAWRRAHQQRGDVVLYGLNARLQEIFSMVGFDKIFRIFDDLPAARAHFGPA